MHTSAQPVVCVCGNLQKPFLDGASWTVCEPDPSPGTTSMFFFCRFQAFLCAPSVTLQCAFHCVTHCVRILATFQLHPIPQGFLSASSTRTDVIYIISESRPCQEDLGSMQAKCSGHGASLLEEAQKMHWLSACGRCAAR